MLRKGITISFGLYSFIFILVSVFWIVSLSITVHARYVDALGEVSQNSDVFGLYLSNLDKVAGYSALYFVLLILFVFVFALALYKEKNNHLE